MNNACYVRIEVVTSMIGVSTKISQIQAVISNHALHHPKLKKIHSKPILIKSLALQIAILSASFRFTMPHIAFTFGTKGYIEKGFLRDKRVFRELIQNRRVFF